MNQQQQQQQNRGGYNNRDSRDNRDNRNGGTDNRNNNGNNQMRGNQGGSARMRGPPMHMNVSFSSSGHQLIQQFSPPQNYRQQNNQGAPIQNNNQNKPSNAGPQQQQQQQNRGNSKQLKFENEFDFEQANSKFEELRTQLSKLKVGSEETKAPEQVNWLVLLFLSPIWRFVCVFSFCGLSWGDAKTNLMETFP